MNNDISWDTYVIYVYLAGMFIYGYLSSSKQETCGVNHPFQMKNTI